MEVVKQMKDVVGVLQTTNVQMEPKTGLLRGHVKKENVGHLALLVQVFIQIFRLSYISIVNCSNYNTCSDCNSAENCGWCGITQQCISTLSNNDKPCGGTCNTCWKATTTATCPSNLSKLFSYNLKYFFSRYMRKHQWLYQLYWWWMLLVWKN